jgi:hypothetical protein
MKRLRLFIKVITFSVLFVAIWAHAAVNVQAQTILTVGPDGTFGTIQAAINAVVVGADTEIRIQAQGLSYVENLLIPNSFTSGSILLYGGWNDGFTVSSDDPEHTVVDGNGNRVLDIAPGGGAFEIQSLSITNGTAEQGAGIFIAPSAGDPVITLRNCLIGDNTASSTGSALGGGIWAILSGSQQLEIDDCLIIQNQSISSAGGLANAGGLGVIAGDSSRVIIRDTEFVENHIETTGPDSFGAAVFLQLSNSSEGDLEECTLFGNTGSNSQGQVFGTGSWVTTSDTAILRVPRTVWANNQGVGDDTGPQFGSTHLDQSAMRMSEAGVVWGDSDGLMISAESTSVVNLVNLTVADNPAVGLSLTEQGGAATLTLYNTISYNNGTDLSTSGTVDEAFNLIGVDPMFIDPTLFDYHLRIGSPAENMGDNDPPGGLSSVDLDGNPRIKDGIVDIGAFEGIAEIFIDGFESGDTSAWSNTTP